MRKVRPTTAQLMAATAKLRAAALRGVDEAADISCEASHRGLVHIAGDPDVEAIVIAATRFDFDPGQPNNPTPFKVWVSHADNVSPGMTDMMIRGGVMHWIAQQDLTLEQRLDYAAMLMSGEHGVEEAHIDPSIRDRLASILNRD